MVVSRSAKARDQESKGGLASFGSKVKTLRRWPDVNAYGNNPSTREAEAGLPFQG